MFGSGTSGFGGFGANNNNNATGQSGSVFGGGGGFGQTNTNTTGGFGSGGGGFGASNTNTNAFGSNTNTTSAFGSGGGGFGSSNTSAFGAKPAFGSTATTGGGGLFGQANNTASTSSGFGFGANNTATTSAFGGASSNTGGTLFGASKPAFGTSSGTTGGNIFGTAGPANTTPAFGSSATANTGTGFGNNATGSSQMPLQGTATVAFEPYQEKEGTGSAMNSFQTIGQMPAYRGFSFEEMRLQDYSQGRRYGNSGGQSGAFGFNSGFGGNTTNTATSGFGATATTTGGGLFGSTNTNTGGAFGSTGGAFGTTNNNATSGGIFGASKPATTGGMFGASNTNTTGGGGGGGIFGANNNAATTNAFGTNTTTGFGANNNTGGGLFGNNNANQQKPGFAFGNTNTAAPATGAFGSTGGAFGTANTNTGGGLFGNNNQQQQPATTGFGTTANTGTGAFGSTGGVFGANTQQPATAAFGTGFGAQNQQQQQKPAFGAFGAPATTPTTGLFGNNAQQPQQQQQQTGGLFGNKPAFGAGTATTGGGLFGNNNAQPQAQTGGGLFGNNNAQPQAQTGGGLFGNNTNTGGLFGQKPAGSGLFGVSAATPTQNTGGGLFGNNNLNTSNQPALGGSVFGQQQQQPQQQQGLFGNSLLNNSMQNQQQQQQQQQQQFRTSIADSPYGNSLLLSVNSQNNTPLGPIATPVGSQTKKAAMIPHYKIAPRNPTLTPRMSTNYTRSVSPFAASGNTPIGASGSLGRSFSTNRVNLFDCDDSLLSPTAFTPGSSSRIAGLKKLVIDKKIRDQDLFSSESSPTKPKVPQIEAANSRGTKGILKKTVSFDMGSSRLTDEELYGTPNPQSVRQTNGPMPTTEELGYIRSTPDRRRNREDEQESPMGGHAGQDGESSTGKELTLIQQPTEDKSRGTYWMQPSAAKMKAMYPEAQRKVLGLTVGRRGYGEVRFEHPVDLTQISFDLEDIPGTVVTFDQRVCTVYPEGLEKPAPGKGLNVPAQITLEDCFPMTKNERGKIRDPEHPRYITHIRRLKNIKDTEFVNYLAEEGIWMFKVMHFTTYGLTEDDEEEAYNDETPRMQQPPSTIGQSSAVSSSVFSEGEEDSMMDADISGMDSTAMDDTFDFKKLGSSANSRSVDPFPGSFLGEETEEYYEEYSEDGQIVDGDITGDITLEGESFLGDGSVGSADEEDEPAEPMEDESNLLEYSTMIIDEDDELGETSELGDRTVTFISPDVSPAKTTGATPKALPLGKDWTEQLNNTISPVKRRFGGDNFFAGAPDKTASPVKRKPMEPLNYGLLDLHDDLYGSPSKSVARKSAPNTRKREQFESPISESRPSDVRPITNPTSALRITASEKFDKGSHDDTDERMRNIVRPAWTRDGQIFYMGQIDGVKNRRMDDSIRTVKLDFGLKKDLTPKSLLHQLNGTKFTLDRDGVPFAEPNTDFLSLQSFAELGWSHDSTEQYERSIWKLASALWDPIEGVPHHNDDLVQSYLFEKSRKEQVSKILQELVCADADAHVQNASTAEEAALAHLTAHRIEAACASLLEGGDLRLATLIPMIGGNKRIREQVRGQIDKWRKRGVLAEVSLPVRALYELVSGETCFSEGVEKPREDAAPSFWFAEHFKLDWKRVIGLKLWYGTQEHEDIAAAVAAYEEDVAKHPTKLSLPRPWYHDSPASTNAVDILWGLLKLYSTTSLTLTDVFAPANFISSNPLNLRLPWQLRTLLAARGVIDYADSPSTNAIPPSYVAGATACAVTTTFAAALEANGHWQESLFALLHLPSPATRTLACRAILARHLSIDTDDDENLTTKLHLPRAWLHEARALRARHAGNHDIETEHLLAARAFAEAHRTVTKLVAPAHVISDNLAPLKDLLSKFDPAAVTSWGTGGQVYTDYIRLVETERNGGVLGGDGTSCKELERTQVVKRLLNALRSVECREFLQSVAVREMSAVVASTVLKDDKERRTRKGVAQQQQQGDVIEAARVLELPLREDQALKKAIELGLRYFEARLTAQK